MMILESKPWGNKPFPTRVEWYEYLDECAVYANDILDIAEEDLIEDDYYLWLATMTTGVIQ